MHHAGSAVSPKREGRGERDRSERRRIPAKKFAALCAPTMAPHPGECTQGTDRGEGMSSQERMRGGNAASYAPHRNGLRLRLPPFSVFFFDNIQFRSSSAPWSHDVCARRHITSGWQGGRDQRHWCCILPRRCSRGLSGRLLLPMDECALHR